MEYHISKSGSDNNPGTADLPFLTIQRAANIALPGDTTTVHEGIYREWINPKNSGTEHARITYRAAVGENVTITGAEPITDWLPSVEEGRRPVSKPRGGTIQPPRHPAASTLPSFCGPEGAQNPTPANIWKTVIPNDFFGDYNPFQEILGGDWYFKTENTYHLGEVYLNGKSMYEAQNLEGVINPQPTPNSGDQEGSLYTWYAKVDNENTTIWANFHGADPRNGNVEINVRQFVFFPELTGRSFITVKGFHLKQAAPQWAPPTAFQGGLIGPHWSNGWIIENNIISDSKNTAVSLGKEISTGHNEWILKGDKGGTQREREVIFRALRHAGWRKGNIGGHIVRNNVIRDCEQAGVVGNLGSAFCVIENNHIYRIHYKRQWHGAEVAGIKFHAALDTLITGNTIHDAYRGLWLDWQAQGTLISRNVFYDNSAEDFMAEVCHGPYLLDHNLFLSKWNVKDMSTGGAFIHNLFLGKIAACVEPERYTPYHFPHETAVSGVANILGGDNRFYNNIFLREPIPSVEERSARLETTAALPSVEVNETTDIGLSNFWNGAVLIDGVPGNATFRQTPVGLSQYDDYPAPGDPAPEGIQAFTDKLPVHIANNVYLNGAEPYVKEKGAVQYADSQIGVEILDRVNGTVEIKITDASKLRNPTCQIITSEMLGQTYQAEMRYENPDGSELEFDKDFHGNQRTQIIPGPFEITEPGTITISRS